MTMASMLIMIFFIVFILPIMPREVAMARAKKPPPSTHEEFVFHLRAPSLSYGFGIEPNRQRREWRPFDERVSAHFVTECIYPDRFKGRESKATIYPEEAMADPKLLDEDDVHRKWIGHIRSTKGEFETALWLPPPMCWRLAEAASSGLITSMLTNGLIEGRSMNRVTSVSFHGVEFDFHGVEFDPVAYIG